MRAGFSGPGRMGAHMTRNLINAGHDVTVWNRSGDKAQSLADETGCAWVSTPAELTRASEVVITTLADDASFEQVHAGPEGLFKVQGATTFLEMGTISPGHILLLCGLAPSSTRVIGAPVSTHPAPPALRC